MPLRFNRGKGSGGKADSISIDRIDNERGYVRGNVQIVSHLANGMKSTATVDQLKRFAAWVIKTYGG
jgi:hypothetical protein